MTYKRRIQYQQEAYVPADLIEAEDLSLAAKWYVETNQPFAAWRAHLLKQTHVVDDASGIVELEGFADPVGATGPGPEALEWYRETNQPPAMMFRPGALWWPGQLGGDFITELKPPPDLAGTPGSTFTLPPYAVASRLRAEFFAHSVSRSGATVAEGTGAKVGNGPAIGGIVDLSYDQQLKAAGAFTLTASSLDEGFLPVLDSTAKEIKLYYENVGLVFHGRVTHSELDDTGNLVVHGFDLAYELQNRSLEYRVISQEASAQGAFTKVMDTLAEMGWSVSFEAVASALQVPKQRWRHETVLAALNALCDVTGLSWRVHPASRSLTIGDFGDDSGLQISPHLSDDPQAVREGALALLDMRYRKDETTLINRVIPQGANTSFGTAIELRHAHNRRDKIGNAEPRRSRPTTLVKNYNFHGVEENVTRSHTTVRPSFLGAYGSPLNPAGPTAVAGPVTDHLDYADDNPDWNIGASSSRVALGRAFSFDADADLAWIASRWAGVLNVKNTGSAYDGYDNMAPLMRIYADSGGSPDEATPLTDWLEPVNFPNFNRIPGIFRTGARPLDTVIYGLPPNEVIHAFPDLLELTGSTTYWAVYAVTVDFAYSATQAEGSWLIPCGGPNFDAHSIDDLGSLWTEGVSAGSLGTLKGRDEAGTWSTLTGGTSSFVMEVSGHKTGSDFTYPVEVMQAIEVNETTNNDLDYETDTHGHRLFFMQDRASIDANGLHSRVVSFPQIRDVAPGLLDVWPQSDALADACTTLLQRAKDPFEDIQGTITGAFALPYVGQKARLVAKGVHETENGNRAYLDLNGLYWVQRLGWRVNDQGIKHEIKMSNIPDDYLDPDRIMAQMLRKMGHVDQFHGELETGANSGATVDPALIGA